MSSINRLGINHYKKLNKHYRMRKFSSDPHSMKKKNDVWIKKPYVPKTKRSAKVSDTIYFGFSYIAMMYTSEGELLENDYYTMDYIISENTKKLGSRMSNKKFHKEMIRLLALGDSQPTNFKGDILYLTNEQINKIDSENTFTVKQSAKIKQVYHTKIPNKIQEMLSSESSDVQNVSMTILLNMIKDNKLRHIRLKKNTSKYLTKIKKNNITNAL